MSTQHVEKHYEQLTNLNVGMIKCHEPLAAHTTIKIGGPADLYIEPRSIDSLQQIVTYAKEQSLPFRAIGRGSNLLVSDLGIEGIVVKMEDGFDYLHIEDEYVTVGAGYSLIKLATQLSKQGLSGLQFAGGIPGSIGGAVYMNAGAHGKEMKDVLVEAKVLTNAGDIVTLTNEQMQFSYRTSVLQTTMPGIVLEATLKLEHGVREEIVAEMQKNKDYRRETQPWSNPCAGSIFRNPLPNYAGKLVEISGLKGYKIGGAQISEMHGNFIVNAGGATAQDVLELIDYVKMVIHDLYEIHMETEVEIIGRKHR